LRIFTRAFAIKIVLRGVEGGGKLALRRQRYRGVVFRLNNARYRGWNELSSLSNFEIHVALVDWKTLKPNAF